MTIRIHREGAQVRITSSHVAFNGRKNILTLAIVPCVVPTGGHSMDRESERVVKAAIQAAMRGAKTRLRRFRADRALAWEQAVAG